jgi:hypothetical protein
MTDQIIQLALPEDTVKELSKFVKDGTTLGDVIRRTVEAGLFANTVAASDDTRLLVEKGGKFTEFSRKSKSF